jgi:Xaa-Pro aminopeptidase
MTAKPGLPCKELDAAARTHIAEADFGKYFSHSLGHGLGLNVHELPRIGENSNDILQCGQVITLEPGIYVPGTGGVRIEDNYRVTGDSVENISAFPREVLRVC